MQTVIGCVSKDDAKVLFSVPEVPGERFREVVEIYACGESPCLEKIAQNYLRTVKVERSSGDYFVVARSFVPNLAGGGRGGSRSDMEKPVEMFDVVFCVPLEAITSEMIDSLDDLSIGGGRGRGMGGGRGHRR